MRAASLAHRAKLRPPSEWRAKLSGRWMACQGSTKGTCCMSTFLAEWLCFVGGTRSRK
ncbi:hypothetical protein IE81DRAFT_321888 [Ceraceosorus guamensis]|uniref:Uncharacterized protein n=1 Tax=Ceraceosorus guamensis TaxID=1522189 RepID=A0A316W250_9BASI|nr:hypothetical protein IE81DRAFT_321888 [Ceraceosorus guamensis]PWN43967.1 hypothetical protein IE81DRAFT_321888 [Ceraceosorus guamensis]